MRARYVILLARHCAIHKLDNAAGVACLSRPLRTLVTNVTSHLIKQTIWGSIWGNLAPATNIHCYLKPFNLSALWTFVCGFNIRIFCLFRLACRQFHLQGEDRGRGRGETGKLYSDQVQLVTFGNIYFFKAKLYQSVFSWEWTRSECCTLKFFWPYWKNRVVNFKQSACSVCGGAYCQGKWVVPICCTLNQRY